MDYLQRVHLGARASYRGAARVAVPTKPEVRLRRAQRRRLQAPASRQAISSMLERWQASSTRRAAVTLAMYRSQIGALLAFPKSELLHLELQALTRDLEQPSRVGDVARCLVQCSLDQFSLESRHCGFDSLLETF